MEYHSVKDTRNAQGAPLGATPVLVYIFIDILRGWGVRDGWIGPIIGAAEEIIYSLAIVSGLGWLFETAGWLGAGWSVLASSIIAVAIVLSAHGKYYYRLAIRGVVTDFFEGGVLVQMPMRPGYFKLLLVLMVVFRAIYLLPLLLLPETNSVNILIGLALVMFLHGFIYNKMIATKLRLPNL